MLRRAALDAMPLKAELAPVESARCRDRVLQRRAALPADAIPFAATSRSPRTPSLRSAPAILYVRAAGVSGDWCKASPQNAASLAKQYGAIVLDINAHGMLNGQPPEYYSNLEQGELRNYWTQGTDDRDTFYFVGMYVRLLRAIEFIATRDAWDGKHLITIGESQGGGQALAAAGLDKRVSAVVALVPAMCDFTGPVVNRLGGWPMPLGRDVESDGAKKVIDAVRYCDNVHLAKRSQADTLIFVGPHRHDVLAGRRHRDLQQSARRQANRRSTRTSRTTACRRRISGSATSPRSRTSSSAGTSDGRGGFRNRRI